MQKIGRELLCKVTQSEQMMQVFDEFSVSVYRNLERVCESCKTLKSKSTMRGRLWSAFHHFCAVSELPAVWKKLFTSVGISCEDQLICQSANQKLFEKLLLKYFGSKTSTETEPSPVEEVQLTNDELNVLQYVGGFVPHALLRRFERHKKKYEQYFECLGEMAVVGENNDFLPTQKNDYQR